jgi:hypothetical protein
MTFHVRLVFDAHNTSTPHHYALDGKSICHFGPLGPLGPTPKRPLGPLKPSEPLRTSLFLRFYTVLPGN